MQPGKYIRTEKHRELLRKLRLGKSPWNKGLTQETDERIKTVSDSKRGKHHAPQSEFKKGHVALFIARGEDSPAWRGGKCKENYKLRRSAKFAKWRRAVFDRDNYTCQDCGKKWEPGVGRIYFQAHHKKSWAEYPKLRFEISNGQTLCVECHKKTDSYMNNKL